MQYTAPVDDNDMPPTTKEIRSALAKIDEMYEMFKAFRPMMEDYARVKDAKNLRQAAKIITGKKGMM